MNCYITLDYELFLGAVTGTPENSLITPMNFLISMLDKYGIKTNLFVDAAYLMQLKKFKDEYPTLNHDWDIVTKHISQMDAMGHAIQLHLHPQWCYSKYNGEKWILDKDHYKLSDMQITDQKQLIIKGTELLNSLIKRRVSAFRGGGWSIENFSELYDTFIEAGIRNDSSVTRGGYKKGKYQEYDYRRIPLKTSYKVSGNFALKKEDDEGLITEYPVSSISYPAIIYLLKKKMMKNRLNNIKGSEKRWGDGQGIGYPGNDVQVAITKIKMLFGKKALPASIYEGIDIEEVYLHTKKHIEGNDFVIVGHPKSLSPHLIAIFEQFVVTHPELEYKLL